MKANERTAGLERVERLRNELNSHRANTPESVLKRAKVAGELEELGVNLKSLGIQPWQITTLRRIRAGDTLPEVLCVFSGVPEAAKAICTLSLERQEQLAGDPFVDLVRKVGEGTATVRKSIFDMTRYEIQLAFNGGMLRPIDEQKSIVLNEEIDGTVKGPNKTINILIPHAEYAVINKARLEHDMTKCAYLLAVLRGEVAPPLKKETV